jgi:hypothetical protein
MNKIKFVYNKVYNFTKGKSFVEIVAQIYAFAVLLPAAVSGILFMFFMLITGQV